MKLKIIELNHTEHIEECESFEFRSNQVTNWIRLKVAEGYKEIPRVSVIKTLEA